MIFLIRMIYNAVDIYSLILVTFAVMSWFPGAYESSLGRWIVALVKTSTCSLATPAFTDSGS
ncbi:integral membrane protein [Streptococcus pneumoniae]|nr:integral membrane protein [Streptococcus pneumoniae]